MKSVDIRSSYEQAKEMMQCILTNRIVMNDAVFAHWIEGCHCFWYKKQTIGGCEFRLVDADTGSNTLAFDHKIIANNLTEFTGLKIDYQNLPITDISINIINQELRFKSIGKSWRYVKDKNIFEEYEFSRKLVKSPDGKYGVFTSENNIWIKNNKSTKKYILTNDGFESYSYAKSHFGLKESIQALWSPDSKYIFTLAKVSKDVSKRRVVQYSRGDEKTNPPEVNIDMAFPGEKNVEKYQLLIVDVSSKKLYKPDYPLLSFSGQNWGFFNVSMGWWSRDSKQVFFIDVSRGAKQVRVVKWDLSSGKTAVLFKESSKTFVKLYQTAIDPPMIFPLPETDELIWFSERSGWGHLYLYDMNTGQLKKTITTGEWVVRDILHYDSLLREVLIQTASRDSTISPYYRDLCKVNIDTGELSCLISGDFEYLVHSRYSSSAYHRSLVGMDDDGVNGVSPCGQYIVLTYSRVNTVPISVLVDRDGKEILLLETADVSGLPKDWHWPEPVKLKGADGVTDVYGVLYRPPGFSSNKVYPVIDFSGGMRNFTIVPQGAFTNNYSYEVSYIMAASLAALGFIVVAIEGRGTPCRDKLFQDYHYGDPAFTSDFEDRMAAIKQLSDVYPYLDIDRVGITALDNVANTVYGILKYPDFYKVAVVNNFKEPEFDFATNGETFYGILKDKDALYIRHHAEQMVGRLEGKLLLIQGMEDIYTLNSTFRLVSALVESNKDFDMLCVPKVGHDLTNYMIRRGWDYLVTHLQGVKPPSGFELTTFLNDIEDKDWVGDFGS